MTIRQVAANRTAIVSQPLVSARMMAHRVSKQANGRQAIKMQKPLPRSIPLPSQSALSPQVRGARVRFVLKQYGWTARELGDQIGVKESKMSKMLNGSRPIEADDAVRIFYALGIPPDWILWGDRRRLERALRKKLPPGL